MMPKPTEETSSGYQVVGVTTPTQVVPDAEMLRRDDTDAGKWTIHSSSAQTGEPKTEITDRQMFVPTYDDEHSRHIRAQQMFHAKVSPSHKDMDKWVKRAWASERTLLACEKLRITTLMSQAGFEPHLHLQDGSEFRNGFQVSLHNDFQSAVLMSVALGETAGHTEFLRGVEQTHPEWKDLLTKITQQGVSFYKSIETHNDERMDKGLPSLAKLNDTGEDIRANGFAYTEQLAKWVETIIGSIQQPPPKPDNPNPDGKKDRKGKKGKKGEDKSEGEGEGDPKAVKRLLKEISDAGKTLREHHQERRGGLPQYGKEAVWGTLRVGKPPLLRNVIGAIGKKRVATEMGRNPRRISRLLTDPQRRIFDRVVKGAGGVVLVDTSGSMSLSEDEVKQLVLHAPSALVAQYSGGSRTLPNLYVIANKGKMCERLPHPHGMNEVDLPALRWAVKNKQRPTSPVIWVSDGYVTGKHDDGGEELAMEVIKFCQKNGVYVVPEPEQAIELLKKLQRREKITSIIPEYLSVVYQEETGRTLVLR